MCGVLYTCECYAVLWAGTVVTSPVITVAAAVTTVSPVLNGTFSSNSTPERGVTVGNKTVPDAAPLSYTVTFPSVPPATRKVMRPLVPVADTTVVVAVLIATGVAFRLYWPPSWLIDICVVSYTLGLLSNHTIWVVRLVVATVAVDSHRITDNTSNTQVFIVYTRPRKVDCIG